MFAIIKSGGKQYKIEPGDILKIEYLGLEKGAGVTFNDILLYENNGKSLIGAPLLENIIVKGKILENKSNNKILIFKKRRRHNSRRLNGHKQKISVVQINDILVDGKIVNEKKDVKKITPKVKSTENKKNLEKKGVEDGA
jgi:large subunit ribosomal protein L21